MNKAIVIKSIVLIAVLALIHSVFWFFKAGQIEKHVNNFITENSAHVSAGEVAVSGFPLSQKVSIQDLKFIVPNSALSRYQATVKKLEAKASIFSNNFEVSLTDQVSVQDLEGSNFGYVEFNKTPEIKLSVDDGAISNFTYTDSGYRILDSEKVVIYLAASSNVTFESSKEDGDKIKNKITADIKDIEGFDVLSVYKNAVEKKVIDGIKTGEISIGNSTTDLSKEAPAPVDPNAPVNDATVATLTTNVTENQAAAPVSANETPTQVTITNTVDNNAPQAANPDNAADPKLVETAAPEAPAEVAIPSENSPIKSNLVLDIEYELVPSYTDQQASAPVDPTQIQEAPTHYSKAIKVNNFVFSNSLYKITVNGTINTFQDDSMPSGAITAKIEQVDNLVKFISEGLNQIITQENPAVEFQASELPVSEIPMGGTLDTATQQTEDPYKHFLKELITNLSSVSKEVAQKNPLSDANSAVFDLRREKNIEILVNETPMREILGKL